MSRNLKHATKSCFVKAKFHYTSWFGASSELASVMEFGFYGTLTTAYRANARLLFCSSRLLPLIPFPPLFFPSPPSLLSLLTSCLSCPLSFY